jgi:hypothetical protein
MPVVVKVQQQLSLLCLEKNYYNRNKKLRLSQRCTPTKGTYYTKSYSLSSLVVFTLQALA